MELKTPIAIVSYGGVFPGGNNPKEWWDFIYDGKPAYQTIDTSRWDPDLFFTMDAKEKGKTYGKKAAEVRNFMFPEKHYKIPPHLLRALDPSLKWILESVRGALEGLSHPLSENQKQHTSVALGCINIGQIMKNNLYLTRHDYLDYLLQELHADQWDTKKTKQLEREYLNTFDRKMGDWDPVGYALGSLTHVASSIVSTVFQFAGFSMVIDAACASSLAAIDVMCKALAAGDTDVGIAGGLDGFLEPDIFIGFSLIGGLSPDHCRPFDHRANGIILGEGAGVVVLKRLNDALADGDTIHGVIRGIGSCSDGKGKAIFAPDKQGIKRSINLALERAGWDADMVDVVEAHATGTRVGDATEYDAVGETLASTRSSGKPLYLGAIKSLIGHLRGGAGIAAVIKTLLSMKHEMIAPHHYFQKVTPEVMYDGKGLEIPTKPTFWEPHVDGGRRALINASGFGGTNFHVALESLPHYTPIEEPPPSKQEYAIVASSCLVPKADNPETLWQNLMEKKQVIAPIEEAAEFYRSYTALRKREPSDIPASKWLGRLNNFAFNSIPFKIVPLRAQQMDRMQQFSLELVNRLDIMNQLETSEERKNRLGIFIGTMMNIRSLDASITYHMETFEQIVSSLPSFQSLPQSNQAEVLQAARKKMLASYPEPTDETLPGTMNNIVSGRVSKFIDSRGPNFTVDAGCCSGLAVLKAGLYYLQSRQIDQMIVGGVSGMVSPGILYTLEKLQVVAPDLVTPFGDKGGMIPSEGGAAFVIKRLEDAENNNDPIVAVISGVQGISKNGSLAITQFSSQDIRKTIKRTFLKTQAPSSQLTFVETTADGSFKDLEELNAIYKESYLDSDRPVYLTSIKAHLGHLFAGADACSLLSTSLALNKGVLPPIQNIKKYNKEILPLFDKLKPVTEPVKLKDLDEKEIQAGILSTDFSGISYFALLRPYIKHN
jgi:acyl transferase domain-containing protein